MSNRLKAATKHEMFSAGENFSTTSEDDQQGLINDLSRIKQEDSSPQSGFAYEELNSTPTASSTQTCPTCGGTGKLTREQEQELVALIPVRDRRLRPRRTVLYLIIAVTISLALCTVAAVLLFPRDITMKLMSVEAVNITIPPSNHSEPFIILKTTVKIHNSNFFTARATNFTAEVTWDNYVVAQLQFPQTVHIKAHENATYDLLVKTEYKKQEAVKLRRICCGWSYNLAFIITKLGQHESSIGKPRRYLNVLPISQVFRSYQECQPQTSVQAYSLTTSTVASDSGYRYINCESGNPVWWWDTCYKS